MANVSYTSLKDLKPFKTSWCIRVKVLHAWNHFIKGSGMSIEMVFEDESGNRIQAGIKKEHIPKFQNKLKKGTWKVLEEFGVTKASGQYRSTKAKYRINILYTTVVTNSPPMSEKIWLDLTEFNSINSGILDPNYLVDVVGQLVNVREMQVLDVKGKPTHKIDFQLRDTDDNRLKCAFWGKFADLINEVSKQCVGEIVICLIRWGKLSVYRDTWSISNAFDASDVCLNPEFPEIQTFKELLPSDGLSLTILGPKPKFVPRKESVQKAIQLPRKTIEELHASWEVEKVRILCTITNLDPDCSWYYFSHDGCNRKVSKNKEKSTLTHHVFWCDNCNDNVTNVVARFWLHLLIKDNTGESKIMLFDSFAEEIVGTTAAELLNGSYEEIHDPLLIPEEVKSIVGKTHHFVLSVEKDNIYGGNDEYKVDEVLSSQNFIEHQDTTKSDNPTEHSSLSSSDQVLMLTDSNEKSDTSMSLGLTPSSKRKSEDETDGNDQSSTNKKKFKDGVESDPIDVDTIKSGIGNKFANVQKFLHKLDEADQTPTKMTAEEVKKMMSKDVKIEKINDLFGKN